MDTNPSPAPPLPSTPSPEAPKPDLKVFGIAAMVIALVIGLWFFWKTVLLGIVFFGTWVLVAKLVKKAGKDQKLAIGGGLVLAVVFVAVVSSFLEKDKSSSTQDSAETEEWTDDGDFEKPPWLKLEMSVRKKLAEKKHQEASELHKELEELLSSANRGEVTPDLLGRIEIWNGNVSFLMQEIKSMGWTSDSISAASTAMGKVYSCLENMKMTWEAYEKFLAARTPEDRRSYSVMHSGALKRVKENLKDSKGWMDEGEY